MNFPLVGLEKSFIYKTRIMTLTNFIKTTGLIAIAVFFFNACTKTDLSETVSTLNGAEIADSRDHASDIIFYALAQGTSLDKFNTSDPETPLNSATITGLQPNEKILGIDFRPATGQLYGVGSSNRLYVINPETGAATAVGSVPFTPALAEGVVAFDFNPTVDRIRLITGSGQNLRLHPTTGAVVFVDGSINGQPGAQIGAVGYTNNFAGATSTVLYGIDIVTEKLYIISPPNNGTLQPVGPLVLNNMGEGGFDISGEVALGLGEVNKKSTLYSVNLATGKATVIYKHKKDKMYTGIAIPIQ